MVASSRLSRPLGRPARRNRQPLGPRYLPSAGRIPSGCFFWKMANGHIRVRTTRGRRPRGRCFCVAANGHYLQRYYQGGQTRYVPEADVIATFGADYLSALNRARTYYFRVLSRLRRRHDAACREAVRLSRAITEADNYARVVAAFRGINHECAVAAQSRVVALRERLASVISQRDELNNRIINPIETPIQVPQ
jgi:hypothetical protein